MIGKEYFSRFDDLMAFVYEEFVSENKYIQYTVDGQNYIYKVFGVYFDYSYNMDLRHQGDYTKEEMNNYLEYVAKLNVYDFDIEVDESDRIITLTTCTRMFGPDNKKQIAVVARQVRENEKMNNYESKANEKYKEIKKIVKGDEENAKA
jgi:sortase B